MWDHSQHRVHFKKNPRRIYLCTLNIIFVVLLLKSLSWLIQHHPMILIHQSVKNRFWKSWLRFAIWEYRFKVTSASLLLVILKTHSGQYILWIIWIWCAKCWRDIYLMRVFENRNPDTFNGICKRVNYLHPFWWFCVEDTFSQK